MVKFHYWRALDHRNRQPIGDSKSGIVLGNAEFIPIKVGEMGIPFVCNLW
jgi:hypothetical protein